jgi:hypothetical protein
MSFLHHGFSVRHVNIAILFLLFVAPFSSWGQDDHPTPARHYIGMGESRDLEAARASALRNMAEQIQVFVSSSFTASTEEHNEHFDQSSVSRTVTRSILGLKGVQENVDQSADGMYRVTKYIARESVLDMFREWKRQAVEHVRLAEGALAVDRIDLGTALKQYYQAYLIATLIPDTISVAIPSLLGMQAHGPLSGSVGIPLFVQKLISSVAIKDAKKIEGEQNTWKCRIEWSGHPVSSFDYEYFDGVGQTTSKVTDGETVFTFFFTDTSRERRDFPLAVEYRYPDELADLLAVADSLHTAQPFDNRVLVTLQLGGTKPAKPVVSKSLPPKPTDVAQLPEAIRILHAAGGTFEGFMSMLRSLVRRGKVVQGSEKDFESLDGLFGVVVGPEGLAAMVQKQRREFVDALTKKKVALDEFAGRRIVWIEVIP